jgi:hypothetical protein
MGLSPVLLLICLGVWTAKGRSPLNFIDSTAMSDPTAFNKQAGARLLVLPAAALLLGVLGFQRPDLSVVCLVGFVLAIIATVVWILLSAQYKR